MYDVTWKKVYCLPLSIAKEKDSQKKKKIIIENSGDSNKAWWNGKRILAKAAFTNSYKEQKNSFCSSDSPKCWFCEFEETLHKAYKILEYATEGNGKHRSVRIQNVNFNSINSMRWAANLKDFKHTETMAQGKGGR